MVTSSDYGEAAETDVRICKNKAAAATERTAGRAPLRDERLVKDGTRMKKKTLDVEYRWITVRSFFLTIFLSHILTVRCSRHALGISTKLAQRALKRNRRSRCSFGCILPWTTESHV